MTPPTYDDIEFFIHCNKCIKSLPDGVSPAEWTQLEIGPDKENKYIIVWCRRCNNPVASFALLPGIPAFKCSCGNPDCEGNNTDKELFELGHVVLSRGVDLFVSDKEPLKMWISKCLKQHHSGDCGDMDADEQVANFEAIMGGQARVFSSYDNETFPDGKIWIITEADRSSTMVLFPSEY